MLQRETIGLVTSSWLNTFLFFRAVAVPLIASIRERHGLALALDIHATHYVR